MPAVERILKWGAGEWLTIVLACGHQRRLRRAEVKAQQLSVGKQVRCEDCAAAVVIPIRGRK